MLRQKCGGKELNKKRHIDLSTLPPPMVCLAEHIKRANYQVAIWKRAHIHNPEIPSPTDDNGWSQVGDSIEPKWYVGCAIPPKLADILETDGSTNSDIDSDDEDFTSNSDEEFVSESDNESDYAEASGTMFA